MHRDDLGAKGREDRLYRAVYEDYADDPVPSRSKRGRFHDVDAIGGATSYLAATPETAWREVESNFFHAKADPTAYRMCEIVVKIEAFADLTDPRVQKEYGVDRRILTGEHQACRTLAARLREDGFEGLWTYSAADSPNGRTLVLFLDLLRPDSWVRVEVVKGADVRT
jgi:RES domain-containing protein